MSFAGLHHSPETIEKMRLAKLGRKPGPKVLAVFRKTHEARRGQPAWNRGIKASPEAVARMSASHRGHVPSEAFREKCRQRMLGNTFLKGFRHSEETKRIIRAACSGSKCHLWRGGMAADPHGPEFNRSLKCQVRERDGFICMICGKTESGHCHDVHHIDYIKIHNDLNNLVTLCHSCHSLTNQNREAWMAYFTERAI